jgi:sec-independent protein translocase protein TatA
MFGSLGIWEILIIFVIIALLFGGKKIPELAKGLGEGIKNFRSSIKKDDEEDIDETSDKSDKDK